MTTRPPNAMAAMGDALIQAKFKSKRGLKGQIKYNKGLLRRDKYMPHVGGRGERVKIHRARIAELRTERKALYPRRKLFGKEAIEKGLRGWANKRPPGKAMVSSGHPIHRIKLGHYRMGHQGRVRFKGQPIGQVSYKPSTGYSATITTWPVKSTHGHGTAQGAMNAIVGHHQRRMRRRAKVGKSAGFGRYYAALMGEDD